MCILMLVKTNNDSVLYTMKKLHITHKHELLSLFFLIPLSIIHHHDTNFNVFTIESIRANRPNSLFFNRITFLQSVSVMEILPTETLVLLDTKSTPFPLPNLDTLYSYGFFHTPITSYFIFYLK